VGFPAESVLVFITVIGINVKNFTHIFSKIPEKLNFEHNIMRECDYRENGIKMQDK